MQMKVVVLVVPHTLLQLLLVQTNMVLVTSIIYKVLVEQVQHLHLVKDKPTDLTKAIIVIVAIH